MRILTPENAAFSPSGPNTPGSVVATYEVDTTINSNAAAALTPIYVTAGTGVYVVHVFHETYNNVGAAGPQVEVHYGFNSPNTNFVDYTAGIDIVAADTPSFAFGSPVLNCLTGTVILIGYASTGFAANSCDYSLRVKVIKL